MCYVLGWIDFAHAQWACTMTAYCPTYVECIARQKEQPKQIILNFEHDAPEIEYSGKFIIVARV